MEMRINCICPGDLSDQHLRAEWLEFLMIGPYIRRSINSSKGLQLSESKNYVLGTGHARFFYNKLKFVENRYYDLGSEMKCRGFKINPKLEISDLPNKLFKEWTPTREDYIININRIIARIQEKPEWYKLRGESIENWVSFYERRYNFKYEYDPSHYGNK